MKEVIEVDVEARVIELEKKYSCKVHPIVFQEDEDSEKIIGYIKEPSRMLKARILDSATTGAVSNSITLLEAVLLTEESDPRFSSSKSEDDHIVLGGALSAMSTIKISTNQFVKK